MTPEEEIVLLKAENTALWEQMTVLMGRVRLWRSPHDVPTPLLWSYASTPHGECGLLPTRPCRLRPEPTGEHSEIHAHPFDTHHHAPERGRSPSWAHTRLEPGRFDGCSDATVDAMNPTTALLYAGPNPMGTGALTEDGGASWQASTIPNAAILSLATSEDSTYAILDSDSGNSASFSLAVSQDGMRTWQPISVPYGSSGSDVLGFWGPVAGSMLAETGVNGTFNLWRSSDGGAHWTAVPLPQEAVSWIEAAPGTRSGSWQIYVQYDDATGFGHIAASTDEGTSWTVLPDLTPDGAGQLSGIASDGAALVTGGSNMYRLSPGATRWQSLGALPPSAESVTFSPTPSGGILWAFPAESDGASGAGPANAVYSAPYPEG